MTFHDRQVAFSFFCSWFYFLFISFIISIATRTFTNIMMINHEKLKTLCAKIKAQTKKNHWDLFANLKVSFVAQHVIFSYSFSIVAIEFVKSNETQNETKLFISHRILSRVHAIKLSINSFSKSKWQSIMSDLDWVEWFFRWIDKSFDRISNMINAIKSLSITLDVKKSMRSRTLRKRSKCSSFLFTLNFKEKMIVIIIKSNTLSREFFWNEYR